MTQAVDTWRPYSRRAALVRMVLPPLDLPVSVDGGLTLTANLRTHFGLFRRRHREREVATAAQIATMAPPDGVIFDLGANIGLYTLVFAAGGRRRVISFEPSPLVLPYLRRNIDRNGLANVSVEAVALSDQRGTLQFTLDETTTCTSHVSAPGEDGTVVDCVDLDSLVLEGRIPPPHVIKIDVEGHDEAILRGSARTLERFRPIVCLEGGLRDAMGEIPSLSRLRQAGYTLWDLGRRQQLQTGTDEYVVIAVPDRAS